MNNKMKNILKIVPFIFAFIVFALGIVIFVAKRGSITIPKESTNTTKTSIQTPQSEILVSAKTSGTKIVFTISPKDGIDHLLAFSARLKFKTGYDTLTATQANVNPEMLKSGWHFLINRVSKDNQGVTTLDLSAVYISSDSFILDSPLDIASIDFPKLLTTRELDLEIDNEVTKFISTLEAANIDYSNANNLEY